MKEPAMDKPVNATRGKFLRAAARRTTTTLFSAQSLGSAGFLTASTINALVAANLVGDTWAGLPMAGYQLGAALAAFVWGHAMDRIGRRSTISLGVIIGSLGAALAVMAVIWRSFPFLMIGLAMMGMANSALQLGRFVAAEVHMPHERGRAIASVVLGGTLGAVCGALIAGPAGHASARLGFPEFAGPYAATSLLLLCSAFVVWRFLRPEPRELALEIAALHQPFATASGTIDSLRSILARPGVRTAVISTVFAQLVMVMLMVMTSLHMQRHQHALSSISFVVSAHVVGMYGLSMITGRLVDRWGRLEVIQTGAVILAVSCLAAPLSPRVVPLALCLFLLGLGWNFCYVGSSSLLSDHLKPAERGRAQGINDLAIGLVSAIGSVGSGVIFSSFGYLALGLTVAAASVAPFVAARRLGNSLRAQTVSA